MSNGATTLADIRSSDWSVKLGSIGAVVQGIEDVEQCIAIILTTPKGSDPLRPTFGTDLWRFIDNPIGFAIPAVVREVTGSISMWEPRITLQSVSVTPANDISSQTGAHLNVSISWKLKLADSPLAPQVTTVRISGGG
jgi:phage baseplate assembly protein W